RRRLPIFPQREGPTYRTLPSMTQKADNGLRALVHKHLRPVFTMTAIETGGTTDGVPDTYWAHRGRHLHGWLEHKATDGWAVSFRPHQLGWAQQHMDAGVRYHIAIRAKGVGASAGSGDSLWLVHGAALPVLATGGLQKL